jgi:hypothetical protein
MPKLPEDKSLADDLLYGGAAIGAFVGIKAGAAFYALQRGHIPAVKRGAVWVASKARLRAHFAGGNSVEPKTAATEISITT